MSCLDIIAPALLVDVCCHEKKRRMNPSDVDGELFHGGGDGGGVCDAAAYLSCNDADS